MPRDRLRHWMEWAGLTQAALAVRIATTQGTVSNLLRGGETGIQKPSLVVAHALERVTSEPRLDGEVWPGGPIRTEEWLTDNTLQEIEPVAGSLDDLDAIDRANPVLGEG